MRPRNRSTEGIKTGAPPLSGRSMAETWLLAMRCPGYRWRDSGFGSGPELENLFGGAKGKGASGSPVRPKVLIRRAGADCPVVAMKRAMPVERRGQAIRVMINLANWQQEEPTGCGGGRQLSLDGTSRVTGDCHARFCERLGVQFPGATRRKCTEASGSFRVSECSLAKQTVGHGAQAGGLAGIPAAFVIEEVEKLVLLHGSTHRG